MFGPCCIIDSCDVLGVMQIDPTVVELRDLSDKTSLYKPLYNNKISRIGNTYNWAINSRGNETIVVNENSARQP